MKKYYTVNNEQEARTVVNLMQGHPSISNTYVSYANSYPVVIFIDEREAYPQVVMPSSVKYAGYRESTIAELLELSLSGWVESVWEPAHGETYYVPALTSNELFYKTTNTKAEYDTRVFSLGLAYPTPAAAAARARRMLKDGCE